MTTPTNLPDERRMFQLTDLSNNHNKYWQVEIWNRAGGIPLVRVTYGRVGAKPPATAVPKPMTRADLDELIRSKEAKGYREVILTASGAISPRQIAEGRALLRMAERGYGARDWASLIRTIERYCETIPTKLPAQFNPQDVARMFAVNLAAQTARLDQLAAAAGGTPVPIAASAPIALPATARSTLPPPVPIERTARQPETSAIDWSALWLSSADAERMAREGVAIPALTITDDPQRDARNAEIDLAALGLDLTVRDERPMDL